MINIDSKLYFTKHIYNQIGNKLYSENYIFNLTFSKQYNDYFILDCVYSKTIFGYMDILYNTYQKLDIPTTEYTQNPDISFFRLLKGFQKSKTRRGVSQYFKYSDLKGFAFQTGQQNQYMPLKDTRVKFKVSPNHNQNNYYALKKCILELQDIPLRKSGLLAKLKSILGNYILE